MATCPECDADIEVDEFDVDKGDELSCPECGSERSKSPAVSPVELDLAPDDEDEDEDEDDVEEEEDDAEEELDDDDEDEKRGFGRMSREGTGPPRHALLAGLASWWPTAAGSTAPTSRCRARYAGPQSVGDHREQPELSGSPSPHGRSISRTRFGLHHEIIETHELERAEYRANPVNRCYYCKHELYTRPDADRRGSRGDCRRWQQRRRSRRLPAGTSGRARVRRAQSAR